MEVQAIIYDFLITKVQQMQEITHGKKRIKNISENFFCMITLV